VAILAFGGAKNPSRARSRVFLKSQRAMRISRAPSIRHEAVEPAPALGFRGLCVSEMDVQSKGRLDVYTSITIAKIMFFLSPQRPFSSTEFPTELLVSHQKIVDTRFRQ